MIKSRANIPSMNLLLKEGRESGLPHIILKHIIDSELADIRNLSVIPKETEIICRIRNACHKLKTSRLQPVINATGILLHTNLGRAPLGMIMTAIEDIVFGYCNLEYDIYSGTRGYRGYYVENALAALYQSEAATVVNNCAAALVAIIATLTTTRAKPKIIISRGELIQIGGGFRIPDIVSAAGAYIKEVGTTNQTSIKDYSSAIDEQTAAILSIHRSNFTMEGFVSSPKLSDLSNIAKMASIPLIADLGSGTSSTNNEINNQLSEPTPKEILSQKANLVCFSGDKLLGGPQSGIIVGDKLLISRIKEHPLFRALRLDKIRFAILQHVIDLHLESSSELPFEKMLTKTFHDLKERANILVNKLGSSVNAKIVKSESRIGGGCCPKVKLDSCAIKIIPVIEPSEFVRNLRFSVPPVISYLKKNQVFIDLKTVLPQQDKLLINAIISSNSNSFFERSK